MTTLVFLLEEPSAKAMLEGILPRLLPPEITIQYLVFEGKQDLHKQLVRKLRFWQQPDSRFVVMRDQDSGDCRVIKAELQRLCREAGHPEALVRIACHELESFYLGDLQAVEAALAIPGLARQQQSRKFRTPDALANAAEELKKITSGRYQKVQGSRLIGPQLTLDHRNLSHSFQVLLEGIQRLCREKVAGDAGVVGSQGA